ncbi:hypothetical protein HA466_0170990 [Hirschfeldia incana]|nr:hypothetical protein HA466_0170990 [Hirschfeldia incana]
MKKIGEDYEYLGELGIKNVEWKIDEIVWDKFVDFCKEEALIRAPLSLLWYKSEKEKMKELRYVYDIYNEEMCQLRSANKLGIDVVEVFVEHECSEHVPGVIQLPGGEEDNVYCGVEEEEHSENDEVDRPKEDDEPEESEDKNPVQKEDNSTVNPLDNETVLNDHLNNEDVGDEVVVDVADVATDVRFQSVFEEGQKAVPDREAYGNGKEEEEKDADSEDERVPVDVEYPDTPVESEDEWEEWNRERKGKGKVKGGDKYHGDYEKLPYIWLFQKFNSGLEFKDQLLKYSMNTQYDVKMARSESFRIGVICCKEKCPFRIYCSVEKPINKWMVKVCHMSHNHGKSSRISMLKQGVIAGLFREELRRNVNLQASAIKDAIKLRCDIVVPISKCYRGRHIALGTILEAQTTQFGKLWDYEEELRRSNNGISTDLCTREKTNKPPIGIPEIRKPRGRPRTRDRKKKPFEALETSGKTSRHGRIPTCSNCHKSGHIKTGCKNQTVVYEGPKNKRGRPRKHLEEDTPKPPSTRKRKTQPIGSSSQPVHATGSSFPLVHATGSSSQAVHATGSSSQHVHTTGSSSQPVEATGSSSDPKPHAKKRSRGPLKVRKTANIPHGVGTL